VNVSDWISSVSTAVVAVVGIAGTYLTGAKGREHAERIAREKNEHDRRMADEQRQQQRRADAYVELLTYAEQVGGWIYRLVPGAKLADLGHMEPDDGSVARAKALLGAYGSAASITYFEAWQRTLPPIVMEFLFLFASGDAKTRAQGMLPLTTLNNQERLDGWPKLDGYLKPQEEEARRALADQLSTELLGTRRFSIEIGQKASPST
jgi:hypothetical protein